MRAPLILLVIVIIAILALVGFNAGWFGGKPGTPAGPGSPPIDGPANPGDPITEPDEPSADGGAEQLPDEPLPPSPPGPPAEPETPPAPVPATFDHAPAGALLPGTGKGYLDRTDWAPGMCFPIADKAYANSQVYNAGGGQGPAGKGQCEATNYQLPWRDTFCETRSRDNPFCVGGAGHQGQDIRAESCKKNFWWTVAAEEGTITNVGTYSITLVGKAAPHRQHRYLHIQMDALNVHEGSKVKKGDKIGKISNAFGGTPTTIHLHYELRAGVTGTSSDGKPVAVLAFLPPYTALAAAYQRKLDGATCQ